MLFLKSLKIMKLVLKQFFRNALNLDINDRYILKKEHIKDKNYNKILEFSKKYELDEINNEFSEVNTKKRIKNEVSRSSKRTKK